MKTKITSLFFLLFFSLLTIISFAQSSNELVRVTTVDNLAALNSISEPYRGSLAFVESRNSIFQFTGTSWQPFGNTWSLNTNKNISPEKFIGTLDSNSFVIRSNDSRRMSVNGDGQVLISNHSSISENAAIEIGSGGSLPKMTSDTTPYPFRITQGELNRRFATRIDYDLEPVVGYHTHASTYPEFQLFPHHPPHHAFDDDPNTFWRILKMYPFQFCYSYMYKAGLIVDFGSPTLIKGINITVGPNRHRVPVNVRLQGSDEYPMRPINHYSYVTISSSGPGGANVNNDVWHYMGDFFRWEFYAPSTDPIPPTSPVSRSQIFDIDWQHADFANNRDYTFYYDSPLPHRYWLVFFQNYDSQIYPSEICTEWIGDTIIPLEYNDYEHHIEFLKKRYFEISELDFILPSFTVTKEGLTGISNSRPSHKLHVNGNVLASGSITPDYVFEKEFEGKSDRNPNYVLMSLEEIERFTKQHNHLPNVPSAQEVNNQGGVIINQAVEKNLEKIEELYLHSFRLQKQIGELKSRIKLIKEKKSE